MTHPRDRSTCNVSSEAGGICYSPQYCSSVNSALTLHYTALGLVAENNYDPISHTDISGTESLDPKLTARLYLVAFSL